jgi:hypothetical protein
MQDKIVAYHREIHRYSYPSTFCGAVLQQPSRKNPLMGLMEQISIGSPSTARAAGGLLPRYYDRL